MENTNQIITLFKSYGGIMTMRDLNDKGVAYYSVRKMIKEGTIETIKRATYKLSNVDTDDYLEAQTLVSRGVFCLYSAALIHELSTFIPTEHHLAIPKKNKVTLPDYPPIQTYYWHAAQYSLGIEQISKNGNLIEVYDIEKTVCDFLKFRNKVGIDTTKEVVKNYLNSNGRQIDKLVKYARQLRLASIVDQYLTILL